MADTDKDLGCDDLVSVVVPAILVLSDVPVGREDGSPEAVSKVVSEGADGVLEDRYRETISLRGVLIGVSWDKNDQVYKLNLYREREDLLSPIGQEKASAKIVFEYVCRTVKAWPDNIKIDLLEVKAACDDKIRRTLAKVTVVAG